MSKVMNIEEYREGKQSTAMTAVLYIADNEGNLRFADEFVAGIKDLKSLKEAVDNILKKLSNDSGVNFLLENAKSIEPSAGDYPKTYELNTYYTINAGGESGKANIYYRIYTYGLSNDDRAKIAAWLISIKKI